VLCRLFLLLFALFGILSSNFTALDGPSPAGFQKKHLRLVPALSAPRLLSRFPSLPILTRALLPSQVCSYGSTKGRRSWHLTVPPSHGTVVDLAFKDLIYSPSVVLFSSILTPTQTGRSLLSPVVAPPFFTRNFLVFVARTQRWSVLSFLFSRPGCIEKTPAFLIVKRGDVNFEATGGRTPFSSKFSPPPAERK